MRLEGLGKLKKSTSSGTQTGDLPACSIVPQPTMLPRAHHSHKEQIVILREKLHCHFIWEYQYYKLETFN
jgi:hypothetical protein